MATPIEALGRFSQELDRREEVDLIPRLDPIRTIRIYPRQSFPDLSAPIEVESFEYSYLRVYRTPEVGSKNVSIRTPNYRDSVHQEFGNLLSTLGGNEVEVDTSTNRYIDMPLFNEFWDDWKDRGLVVADIYSEQIYLGVIQTIEDFGVKIDEKFKAVDLFGGDGEFSEKLSSQIGVGEFHVIDQNVLSLGAAKSRSGNLIVHSPVDLTNTEDVFNGVENPNLVTAIGGLCAQVVSRKQALRIAQKVFDGLGDGGVFIITGYSHVLLNASDFRSIGYEVLNMSVPGNIYENAYPKQLYVLRKPVSE